MSRKNISIENRLLYNRARLERIYDSKTAFGNPIHIALIAEIEKDAKYLEEHERCLSCDGVGTEYGHECDCEWCVVGDCRDCKGEGYIKK